MANVLLQEIGNQIGYSISYDADLLRNRLISLPQDSVTVGKALSVIFELQNPRTSLIGKQLVVLKPIPSFAAPDSCLKTVSGHLMDHFTGLPIAGATVIDTRHHRMTVTNKDGAFILNLPCENDHMEISIEAIGYFTRTVSQPFAKDVLFQLQGTYLPLQEVIILSVPAEQLVKSVINKIPENYLQKPTNAQSFFREAVIKNGVTVGLSEAVFTVYNTAYFDTYSRDQVQLMKGRKFLASNYNDTIDFKIKGSLLSCFQLDVVKHRPTFLNINELRNYHFTFRNVLERDGDAIYVIAFHRDKDARGLPYAGTLYIDKESLSIRSVEFGLDKKNLKKMGESQFIIKKAKGVKTRFQGAKYTVNYTTVDGKLVMNHVRLETSFRVRNSNSFFYSDYETISEYVVNQFSTEDVVKIRNRDAFTSEGIFMEQPLKFDPSYWNGINYLPIDRSLLDASNELQMILSNQSPR